MRAVIDLEHTIDVLARHSMLQEWGNPFEVNGEVKDSLVREFDEHVEIYRQLLTSVTLKGYFVDNLWSVDDVADKYICTQDKAMDILRIALTNEGTMSQVHDAIKWTAEDMGLLRRGEEAL
jgi:hypothetical protein